MRLQQRREELRRKRARGIRPAANVRSSSAARHGMPRYGSAKGNRTVVDADKGEERYGTAAFR